MLERAIKCPEDKEIHIYIIISFLQAYGKKKTLFIFGRTRLLHPKQKNLL